MHMIISKANFEEFPYKLQEEFNIHILKEIFYVKRNNNSLKMV